MKIALITGITGQDGSYLAELLLEKGYEVHGIKRRSSSLNTDRIDHLYQDPHHPNQRLKLHYGDLTDAMNLTRIIEECQPDEIYNLGAMSHVKVSFDTPEYVGNVDGLGTLRILEAVRLLGLEKKTRIYQASTSELYGGMPCKAISHRSRSNWLNALTTMPNKPTRGSGGAAASLMSLTPLPSLVFWLICIWTTKA